MSRKTAKCVIVNSPKEFELDVKRFYIPGTTLSAFCPRCGTLCEWDFDGEYISYPAVNKPEKHTMVCLTCSDNGEGWEESEFDVEFKLKVELEAT